MIFFGTRSRTVGGDVISGGLECQTCGHREFRSFGYQHYFHLYWVPTFPTGRTVGLECTHCRHTLVNDEIPEALASRAMASAFGGVRRLPLFTGLILIGMLVLYGLHAAAGAEARSEGLLDQPSVGDYYVVDLTKIPGEADSHTPYTIWRLSEVTADALHFDESLYAYEYWSDATSDIRSGTASAELDVDGEGVYVDMDQMAAWRAASVFPRVLRP